MKYVEMNSELSVGSCPNHDDVKVLINAGYRTIIDLRADGELGTGGLPREEEQRQAEAAGLTYDHIPVPASGLDNLRTGKVRLAIWSADVPAFLHCANGATASTLALVHVGCQQMWTVERCLKEARRFGLDSVHTPRLCEFVKGYVRSNSLAYPSKRSPEPRESALKLKQRADKEDYGRN